MNVALIIFLAVFAAVIVLGIFFKILKTIFRIFSIIAIFVLVLGGFYVGFAHFEMQGFQEKINTGDVAFLYEDDAGAFNGVISKGVSESEFIRVDAKSIKELQERLEYIFVFDVEAFGSNVSIDIKKSEKTDDKDISIFVDALNIALNETSGSFVVESYLDGNLVITPPLYTLKIMEKLPISARKLLPSAQKVIREIKNKNE
jgi:hypothetical protein